MAGLLKTPSLHLTPTLLHAPSVPFKPFCVSFAGGRNTSVSLSRRASLRSVSSGYPLRLLNLVPFASGEAETTETEVESNEPELQETDGAVDVENENAGAEEVEAEEEEAAVVTALLNSYKEALAENNEGKIAEIEASLKSIEDEKNLLADKVASLSNELSVERDRLIRISADFDNFRKRTERERLNLVSNAQGEVVENLLAVLDNFERAKSQIKVETEGEEKVTNSYQSIYKQFVEILGSLGVIHVETVGKQFDPMLHEAIMREDSSEYEEGIVLEEYRKGFLLGERLLRPSMVKVSAGPGPEKPREAEVEETTAQGSSEEAASSS
ncbi:GrpE nucleotide exchange factor coiled-coil [Arabidopsis suecica]|uniref:GrpE nucleotide exchange factor coiled-coil n=1 Tax=Arabidopsis suecica TaxID=45249 RepID=A0A8T1ZC63_ARASU|nr:GrpE nucleotide exchange factor coiled-coil [Arabidopsis suecica]